MQAASATRQGRLILISGLPGTGKTTLARRLARRHGLPLLAKDTVKEPLMDALLPPGAVPRREDSRQLSDASFAVLFALAGEQLALGMSLILEGNFRKGGHEVPIAALQQRAGPFPVAQILCHLPDDQRLARIRVRQTDPSRHPGHHGGELAPPGGEAGYLDLPGERFEFTPAGDPPDSWLRALDKWLAG